jgi:hypothetical protein
MRQFDATYPVRSAVRRGGVSPIRGGSSVWSRIVAA